MKTIPIEAHYSDDIRLEVDEEQNGIRFRVEGIATPLVHRFDAEAVLAALSEELDPRRFYVRIDGGRHAGEPGEIVGKVGPRLFTREEAVAYIKDARLWLGYRDDENAASFEVVEAPL